MTYVLIFPLKTNDLNNKFLQFNLAEFISEIQTSFAIQQFLEYLANEIEMLTPSNFQLIHEIVVDWSWAEMNAIVMAFNRMTIKEYLQLTFLIMTTNENNSKLKNVVILLECSSHLTKTMKSDTKKFFTDYKLRSVVYEIMGKFFDCETWAELLNIMKNFIIIFTSSSYDNNVKESLKVMEKFKDNSSSNDDITNSNDDSEESEDEQNEMAFERRDQKEIYKDSPFYQVFFITT